MSVQTDLADLLRIGESSTVEFKRRADALQIAKTACAFANTDGGDIYIGVDDDASVEMAPGASSTAIVGVNPESVRNAVAQLPSHFQGTTPLYEVEQLSESGPDGVVMKVHVPKRAGRRLFRLSNGTVLHRLNAENVTRETYKQLRDKDVEDEENSGDEALASNQANAEPSEDATDQARQSLWDVDTTDGRDFDLDIVRSGGTIQVNFDRGATPQLDRLATQYKLSATMRQVVEHANKNRSVHLGSSIKLPFSSAEFFFAFLDYGSTVADRTHAAAFLANAFSDSTRHEYVSKQGQYFAAAKVLDSQLEENFGDLITEPLTRLLAFADELRRQVIASPEDEEYLSARHFAAAVLLSERKGLDNNAWRFLRALDMDLRVVKEAYERYLLEQGYESERQRWRAILGQDFSPRIARLNADSLDSDDALNIMPDVQAMAGLICSRSLKPPLSIGLFGSWGAGKSFFMQKLFEEVGKLRSDAASSSGTQQMFWENIVQVRFNAWHYMDSNLWASLVTTIFDRLRKPDDSPNAFQDRLDEELQKLSLAEASQKAAKARLTEATKTLERANKDVAAKEQQLKNSRQHLIEAIERDVWQAVKDKLPAASGELKTHLQEIGIASTDIQASSRQLYSHLQELETMAGRLRATVLYLFRTPDSRRTILVGLAGICLVFVIASVLAAFGNWGWFVGIFGELAAVVSTGAILWRSAVKQVSAVLGPAMKLKAKMDIWLDKARREKQKEIVMVREELKQYQSAYEIALKEHSAAEDSVAAMKARVEEVQRGDVINQFVLERASSEEYRRHLGLISTIRHDFEHLSSLISGYNSYLETAARGMSAPTEVPNLGINRVVLYIDDLDRCPSGRVVEVLQAIHLLLAFELFVVVVAVDVRWVSHSLQEQYSQLKAGAAIEIEDGLDSRATPRDYLEKIFQVPYWIDPMEAEDCRRLIDALVADDRKSERFHEPPSGSNARTADEVVEGGEDYESTDVNSHEPMTAVEDSEADPSVSQTTPESLAIHLSLTAEEIGAMKELAAIIGRSPRETKRFVNIYRLFKASELARSPDSLALPGSFHAPMCLLAIASRAAASVEHILSAMELGQIHEKELDPVLRQFVLPNHVYQGISFVLQRHERWAKLTVKDLEQWLPRVRQFSFGELESAS